MSEHDPTTCHVCGRHATGIGFDKPLRWLCAECLPLIEYVKDIKRWDAYEVHALKAVDAATGDYAADHGTDIAAYDETTRRGLWTCAIKTHQAEIRRLVRSDDAPF